MGGQKFHTYFDINIDDSSAGRVTMELWPWGLARAGDTGVSPLAATHLV